MRESRAAERASARRAEWVIPGADVLAGAAEVGRLVHAALPVFSWGRRSGSAWVLGPVPEPRRLPDELTDAEHAGYLVRLAGLLSFLVLVVFIGEAVREAFDPREYSRLR